MVHENTIKRKVSLSGIGLHSGKPVTMRLWPAPEGSGIIFRRADLESFSIPVRVASVVSTLYSTTIGIGDVRVQTVEHLLAALYALGIDNLFVDLDGEEVPIEDGSSTPFVNLLREAGQVSQKRLRGGRNITRPVTLIEGNGRKWIRYTPAPALTISYTIEFDHPLISRQSYTYHHNPRAFIREIAPARTFGFLKDVKHLLETGLVRGGSLANAIVVGEEKILNEEGLRFSNEFVRHKILDLIGDLALLGRPLTGLIEAHHAGHALHTKLIAALRPHEALLASTVSDETAYPAVASAVPTY